MLGLALAGTGAAAEPAAAPDPIAILSGYVLSRGEMRDLLAGGTVVVRTKEVSERELAIVLACLTSESPAGVMDRFRGDPHPLSGGSHTDWSEVVPVDDADSALGAFMLGGEAEREARRFFEAEPGFALNLSLPEIARFRALREEPKARRLDRVDETLRVVLAERLSGFARAGLEGTPPYARGDGEQSRPAWELEQSYEAFRVRPPVFPGFAEAWNDYPKGLPKGAPQQFFVTRAEINDRPTVILTHRMELVAGDKAILAERDFYVSQFFDSALNVVAALPSDEIGDNLLLFIERVWVDRWNGMVQLKRSVGQKKMEQHVRQNVAARKVCR